MTAGLCLLHQVPGRACLGQHGLLPVFPLFSVLLDNTRSQEARVTSKDTAWSLEGAFSSGRCTARGR